MAVDGWDDGLPVAQRQCNFNLPAFAPQGRLIGRFDLKPGDFDIIIDRRFRKLHFGSDGLIGIAPQRNDPDGSPRLFRSRFR